MLQLKNRPSLDSLGKETTPEKVKDDKKKKEKRGMLGGMFKRKDKTKKGSEKDVEENEKTSSDLSRQSQEGNESLTPDGQGPKITPQPHRQTSKLQKQPPAKLSPKSSYQQGKDISPLKTNQPAPDTGAPQLELHMSPDDPNGFSKALQPELQSQASTESPSHSRSHSQDAITRERSPSESFQDDRGDSQGLAKAPLLTAPLNNTSAPSSVNDLTRTTTASSHGSQAENLVHKPSPAEQHHLDIAQAAQHEAHEISGRDVAGTLPSQEPVEPSLNVRPLAVHKEQLPQPERIAPHQPPPLVDDDSSTEDPSFTRRSLSSSPEPVERPSRTSQHATHNGPPVQAVASADRFRMSSDYEEDEVPAPSKPLATNPTESTPSKRSEREVTADPTTPSSATSTTTPTAVWSDAGLRAYLDSDSTDIQDLLLVVHDKTGVVPRKDHPVVKNMYREENRKLDEISANLDGLLNQYLARKNPGRSAGTGAPVRS